MQVVQTLLNLVDVPTDWIRGRLDKADNRRRRSRSLHRTYRAPSSLGKRSATIPNMSSGFRRGARAFLVLAPPLAGFGLAIGVLGVKAGIEPWLVTAASAFVLSGSAQAAWVGLYASGPAAVLIATVGLGLRHIPMSASLRPLLGCDLSLPRRLLLAHFLVDETYGLTISAARNGEPDPAGFVAGADVVLYVNWVGTTAVGAYLGSSIDPEQLGLGVIFPLMFLGIALPLIHDRRHYVTASLAVGLALVAVLVVPPAWQVTGAAVLAAAVGSRFK